MSSEWFDRENIAVISLLLIVGVLVGTTGYFYTQGTVFGDESKYTDAQLNAEPNEVVSVEKTASASASISMYEFDDDEESETISVWVPENSMIQSIRMNGQATAFGSTGKTEASVESDYLYAFTSSEDVGNAGSPSTDSKVYTSNDGYYVEEPTSFNITAKVFVPYDNANNYGESEGTVEVKYKHLEMLEAYQIKRNESGAFECGSFEYRSDKEPENSIEGDARVYDNSSACMTELEEVREDDDSGSIFDPPSFDDGDGSDGSDGDGKSESSIQAWISFMENNPAIVGGGILAISLVIIGVVAVARRRSNGSNRRSSRVRDRFRRK